MPNSRPSHICCEFIHFPPRFHEHRTGGRNSPLVLNFDATAPVEISGTEQDYNISSAFLVFSTSVSRLFDPEAMTAGRIHTGKKEAREA